MILSAQIFAQDLFIRSGVIPVPEIENGGFGNVVSGVDLDGDGLTEIYAVNDNWSDSGDELIPRIYMYEEVDGEWTLQWMSTLAIPLQNTWPALTTADLDGDGRGEVVWGPVNNLGDGNTDPARLIVFEANGNDNELGVSDGAGGWLPNSAWNMDVADDTNMRPFRWFAKDIDNDGVTEIVFSDRAGSSSPYQLGVASVDNIPDAGDGSETWTLEFANSLSAPGFVRSAVLNADPVEPGGFGNVIAGVDFDGDGALEIYAVNDNWADGDYEVIPRMYKFEWNGAYWEIVWQTVIPGIPAQNTWPAMDYADTDGDGKMEIFFGPVNFLTTESQNPSRVVVYEVAGDGSDVLGVDDGAGNYAPNAQWSIVDTDGENERPFRWHIRDIDGDGTLEVVAGFRAGNMRFGIFSVDNVPDNGDGSETWTLEASGLDAGMVVDAGTVWDIAVVDNFAYLIHDSGNITPIAYEGGAYVSKAVLEGAAPGGSWKSASVVDLDGDGNEEIVVGQWLGGAQVYLLQPNGDGLDMSVIGDFAGLNSTRLNGGSFGDLDGDGNLDFVFGSRTTYADPNGSLYRLSYNGGDITDAGSYSTSIIDHSLMEGGQYDVVVCGDVDGDGNDEALYSGVPRSAATGIPLTIVDYSDGVIGGGSKWDIAIANGNIYGFDGSGNVYPVQYVNDTWQVLPMLSGVVLDGGSFKGSAVADIDGDGTEEIMVGGWSGAATGKIFLLQEMNGGLKTTEVADLTGEGAARFNGADAGDIDGDGYMDFVFGSRDANGAVFRLEYRGGDIADPANYVGEKIDELPIEAANQVDIVTLANVDGDADLEVIYSGIPRGGALIPITILDLQKIETTPIADVRVDSDGNGVPDNLDTEFTVAGIVTSPDFSGSWFDIAIQDETAGIRIVIPNGGDLPIAVGDRIQVTGTLTQFNGSDQLETTAEQIVSLGVATVPAPMELTIPEFLENAEAYESMLVKFNAVAKGQGEWPSSANSDGLTITDGYNELAFFVDKDTDLATNPEPEYPMNIVGIAGQYDNEGEPDAGYELIGRFYSDIEQNVAAPPSPFFYFTDATRSMYDGQTVEISAVDQNFEFSWDPAVDLNDDPIIYQFQLVVDGSENNFGGDASTTVTLSGQQIMNTLGGATTKEVELRVRAKGSESAIITSVDVLTTTFDVVVSVDENSLLPTQFTVDQNYPNPFNPATTIRYGLPAQAKVTLKVYDILGSEVATLINNEIVSAGYHQVNFNAGRLASGTYIYRLQADNKVEIKKMLLLK